MIKNYLIIALRNLNRYRIFSIINILGFSVGLALAVVLLSFIRYEKSYESFNPKANRIYRSVSRIPVSEKKSLVAPLADGKVYNWVKAEIPEVESILRLDIINSSKIAIAGNSVGNFRGLYSDESFFDFFNFSFKYGNPSHALNPGRLVITEKMSEALFGSQNSVGEIIKMDSIKLEVGAVLDNLPQNTHLKFDYLIPFSAVDSLDKHIEERGVGMYCYYMLGKKFNHPSVVNKLENFIEQKSNRWFEVFDMKLHHNLQRLTSIHLDSENLQYNISPPGSVKQIFVLSILSLFILVIAVINYINLEISRSESRFREVAIRKVIGAQRRHLIGQFIGESFVIVLIAFLLALIFVEILNQPLEQLLDRPFSNFVFDPLNVLLYGILTVIVSTISGFYPAFVLSSYSPLSIFQSTKIPGNSKTKLRTTLVIIQFVIATFLIINLSVVYSQIKYMKSKDLGFDKEHVLVLGNLTNRLQKSYSAIKNELERSTEIIHVAGANGYPGNLKDHYLMRKNSRTKGFLIKENVVKDDYQKTLGLEVVLGRYFAPEFQGDSNAFVINERASAMLGYDNPIGEKIHFNRMKGRIVGVVKDYHVEGLKEEIMPVMHTQRSKQFRYFLIRIQPNSVERALNKVKEFFWVIDKKYVLDYTFLDDYFDNMYKKEERINKSALFSSIIAIVIALMGLYALTSFIVLKNRKAIGIRKVMGAKSTQIAFKLMKGVIGWVILSVMISCPLSYLFMQKWFENFAYHIDISVWFFVSGVLVTFLFGLLIVGFQSYRAAVINPADTLREE